MRIREVTVSVHASAKRSPKQYETEELGAHISYTAELGPDEDEVVATAMLYGLAVDQLRGQAMNHVPEARRPALPATVERVVEKPKPGAAAARAVALAEAQAQAPGVVPGFVSADKPAPGGSGQGERRTEATAPVVPSPATPRGGPGSSPEPATNGGGSRETSSAPANPAPAPAKLSDEKAKVIDGKVATWAQMKKQEAFAALLEDKAFAEFDALLLKHAGGNRLAFWQRIPADVLDAWGVRFKLWA